jgi:putative ABC transport system permease protein
MISHYLKLAKRDLLKNRYYTFINIFGLVFGMLSALVIVKYIGGSLQFDSFHLKKDRIYSISQTESINGEPQNISSTTYWGVVERINQYPEVEATTRYSYHIGSLVIADDGAGKSTSFHENKIFSVDSSFLQIFTFPMVYGDPATALSRPNSIVVTRSAAHRYFKNLDPVGKTLTMRVPWGAESAYEVTGVIDDAPVRSQFKFDFLITRVLENSSEFWLVPDCATYLLVKDNADVTALADKLTGNMSAVPELKSTNRNVVLSLGSLADVQLSRTEHLLIAVGIFIALISWVNYINQVIAQSHWRMKQIGVLRVMGATRSDLKVQFIVESALTCVTSLVLVVALYVGLEPTMQSFTDGRLLPLINDPTPINIVFLLIFAIGIVLAAGIATVIFFSQNFGTTLRGVQASKIGGIGLRKALVVVQFSISAILMISVFVISNQLDYMSSADKGIDMDDVLIISEPIVRDADWSVKRKTVESFKDQCAALPFVKAVSSSTTIPSEEYRQETYLSLPDKSKSMVHQNGVDENFFGLYNVKFVAGHDFIPDARAKNRSSIILNESAARALGIVDFDKMIDARITDHESDEVYDLIGIVEDYHQTSLKYEMRPIAFKYNVLRGHFSLRINRSGLNDRELQEKLGAIKQIWFATYRDAAFEYFFLDAKFAAQDREDFYFGKLFGYFTILSIVISCLGLFGLSLLISAKRQKEIGVRKVFGASSLHILNLVVKGYLGSLGLAMLIGTPAAYQLMTWWLSNYAYRIAIGWELVSVALLTLTLVFLVTIAYHTIKSSMSDPVKVLRD